MSSITCVCDDPIQNIPNDKCDALQFGNQIVKIFAQKMTGTDFDGTGGNTITVEADWLTKLASDDDDRIVVIPSLSGAVRPSAEPNMEEGNDVPYGGVEIIDRPQEITFNLKYFSTPTFEKMDQVACWGLIRFWFLDNNDYLWCSDVTTGAGIEDASLILTTMSQAGIGTKNKSENNKIAWNNLCQPRSSSALKLSFLKTLEGSDASGSTI
jgi:hypothetical protein